jgi:ABC-type nitrate/sulfonate/bicarbonate transport system permease component
LALVVLINFVFRRSFLKECETRLVVHSEEFQLSNKLSPLGVALLTIGWVLVWHTTCLTNGFDPSLYPIPAIERVGELLIDASSWGEIRTSMVEVGGGIFFGGLLALATSIFLARSKVAANTASKILLAMYITPIILWMFAFIVVFPRGANDHQWFRTFFLGEGHKIMGVGFLVFFPCIRAFAAFRDSAVASRYLMAIADALPIAFVAMCFGEMFAATAGLGFQMVVAGATFQHEQTLAWFFITLTLLAALSTICRLMARVCGLPVRVEAIKAEVR